MTNPMVAGLLKNLGIDPSEMVETVQGFRSLFEEIRTSLNRIEAQNALIMSKLDIRTAEENHAPVLTAILRDNLATASGHPEPVGSDG